MTTDDPIELIIAGALRMAGIRYSHESDNKAQGLDFHLTDSDVYIECKQFPTARTGDQIAPYSDVIVIQGRKAALAFAVLINKKGRASP